MAVAPTGAIYKALKFDNVSSRTYGVYITGEAVYNAPERDVEMITIPGRSGSFALDNGRFENIEVSYPAGIYADTEADFRQAISDFRNFLCSRKGYVRLQDEYNPDEYRMAVYKSGLDVDPALLRAGEFTITFDCKPQRWLTSGETAVTVTSGDTLTNPTLFESSPLLELVGYGDILLNEEKITINALPYGRIMIANSINKDVRAALIYETAQIDVSRLNTGDTFIVKGTTATMQNPQGPGFTYYHASITALSNCTGYISSDSITWSITINDTEFEYGTSKTLTAQMTVLIESIYRDTPGEQTLQWDAEIRYDGNKTLKYVINRFYSGTVTSNVLSVEPIYADSTKPTTDLTIFVDLGVGEAWNYDGTTIASLNNIVQLPAELPTLKPQSNLITFDNTIDSLKITPRWWKV